METYAQIKSNLKQLRLSSFYENFEARVSEAMQISSIVKHLLPPHDIK